MAVHINTNVAALRATSDFARVERDSQVRRARLASGLSVNSGRDSGACLSISEGMRAEIGGLAEGTRNAEHALDLLRTAEGAMNEISSVLIRMRELAIESASDTLTNSNRETLDAEFNQLKEFIDRIAHLAGYNDKALLSGFGNEVDPLTSTAISLRANTGVRYVKVFGAQEGNYIFLDNPGDNALTLGNGVVTQTIDFGRLTVQGKVAPGTTLAANFDHLGIQVELAGEGVKGMEGSYADGDLEGTTLVVEAGTGGSFQLGSDAIPADRLEYDLKEMTPEGPVIDLAQISLGTRDSARHAIAKLDQAIARTTQERGAVGAVIKRLEYTLDFTANALESIGAAESTVRDADFAWETSHLARNQILTQSSLAALIRSQIPIAMVMKLLQEVP